MKSQEDLKTLTSSQPHAMMTTAATSLRSRSSNNMLVLTGKTLKSTPTVRKILKVHKSHLSVQNVDITSPHVKNLLPINSVNTHSKNFSIATSMAATTNTIKVQC